MLKLSMLFRLSATMALAWGCSCVGNLLAAQPILTVTNTYHLGNNVVTNWPEASTNALGTRASFAFDAPAADSFQTLGITGRDVQNRWRVLLNGTLVDQLKPSKVREGQLYRIPSGALRAGRNELVIDGGKTEDDITVGPFEFYPQRFSELLNLRPVTLSVTDGTSGNFVPARVAILGPGTNKADIYSIPSDQVAIRPGLIYVNGNPTTVELRPGKYSLYCARGMEWSMAQETITVADSPQRVLLEIRRVVDTAGFVAADTHLHTLTHSGHGDASVDERVLSLAGDGVEFAVATDHNHQTDYGPVQRRMNLNYYYTSVVGNEVSTANGHFNAFPLKVSAPVPNQKQSDWVKLVADIRTRGAKVVVLNHPRWPDAARNPFTKFGVNRGSGERATGTAFHFDAMELVNSTGLQKLPMYLFEDWFALLNYGEKITAVGTSDAHSVHEPVGQGRTYVRSSTDDPARLDVDEICSSFLRGRSSVSLGIFTDVRVNESYTMGDLIPKVAGPVRIKLRIGAPAWVSPRTAKVFLNGELLGERRLEPRANVPFAETVDFSVPAPKNDAWLVCVVLGDGVKNPVWPTMEDYTLAATNPLWLDATGDGKYQSPRDTASSLISSQGSLDDRKSLILQQPASIAVQIASLVRQRLTLSEATHFDAWLKEVSAKRPELADFIRYLPTNSKK